MAAVRASSSTGLSVLLCFACLLVSSFAAETSGAYGMSGCKRAGLQRACRPPQLPRAHAACSAGARVLKNFNLR